MVFKVKTIVTWRCCCTLNSRIPRWAARVLTAFSWVKENWRDIVKDCYFLPSFTCGIRSDCFNIEANKQLYYGGKRYTLRTRIQFMIKLLFYWHLLAAYTWCTVMSYQLLTLMLKKWAVPRKKTRHFNHDCYFVVTISLIFSNACVSYKSFWKWKISKRLKNQN